MAAIQSDADGMVGFRHYFNSYHGAKIIVNAHIERENIIVADTPPRLGRSRCGDYIDGKFVIETSMIKVTNVRDRIVLDLSGLMYYPNYRSLSGSV